MTDNMTPVMREQMKTLGGDGCDVPECEGGCLHIGEIDFIEAMHAVRKEAVEEMQHIVQGYFKNILDDAPCPNFTKNLSLTDNKK